MINTRGGGTGDHDLVPILFGPWGLVPHSQLLPNCGRLNPTMLCTMVQRHVAVLVKVGQIEGSKGRTNVCFEEDWRKQIV